MSDLEILEEYQKSLFIPSANWPEYEFKKRSYSMWAMKEIIELVQENKSRPVIDILRDFWNKMDDYSELGTSSFMFEVARDLAKEILWFFIINDTETELKGDTHET